MLRTDKQKKVLLGNYPAIHLIIRLEKDFYRWVQHNTLNTSLGGKKLQEAPSPKTEIAFPLLSFNFAPTLPVNLSPARFSPFSVEQRHHLGTLGEVHGSQVGD